MKVVGYMPLHYGTEYLKESLEAVLPVVEKFFIIYSDQPSHGHGNNHGLPETEQQLKEIAFGVEGKEKIVWVNQHFHHEGEQRNYIYKFTGGYDMLVTCDSDEVFSTEELSSALRECRMREEREFGIDGYVNFWRSFNEVCYDGFRPVRIINLNNHVGTRGEVKCTIYHFGCAQKESIMRYKYKVHGHADEIRPNWLDEVYYGDTKEDLHCVSIGLWNSVPYDKNLLREALKNHPNFNKIRI